MHKHIKRCGRLLVWMLVIFFCVFEKFVGCSCFPCKMVSFTKIYVYFLWFNVMFGLIIMKKKGSIICLVNSMFFLVTVVSTPFIRMRVSNGDQFYTCCFGWFILIFHFYGTMKSIVNFVTEFTLRNGNGNDPLLRALSTGMWNVSPLSAAF